MSNKRPSLPSVIETEILVKSARRCALCHGVNNDFTEKSGQIAHLDKNASNHSLSNLAFLCLFHHDKYDGSTSQSKGYKKGEVVKYRETLYEKVSNELGRDDLLEAEASREEEICELIHKIINRYYSLGNSPSLLEKEIIGRCKAYFEYTKENSKSSRSHLNENDQCLIHERLRENFLIPDDSWGLSGESVPLDWIDNLEDLIPIWVAGNAEYDDCTDILWMLDECYDLDPTWFLFGLPLNSLPRLGYQLLENFVYVYGMRGQSNHRSSKD